MEAAAIMQQPPLFVSIIFVPPCLNALWASQPKPRDTELQLGLAYSVCCFVAIR